jgi:hypothetical protein
LAVLLVRITIVTGRPVDICRSCINIAVPSSLSSIPRLDCSWKYLTPEYESTTIFRNVENIHQTQRHIRDELNPYVCGYQTVVYCVFIPCCLMDVFRHYGGLFRPWLCHSVCDEVSRRNRCWHVCPKRRKKFIMRHCLRTQKTVI